MSKKTNILIDLRGRLLDDGEADELRAFVEGLRVRVHLIKGNWPWAEIRGISEEGAARAVEQVRALAPNCIVSGLATTRTGKALKQPRTFKLITDPKEKHRESKTTQPA